MEAQEAAAQELTMEQLAKMVESLSSQLTEVKKDRDELHKWFDEHARNIEEAVKKAKMEFINDRAREQNEEITRLRAANTKFVEQRRKIIMLAEALKQALA